MTFEIVNSPVGMKRNNASKTGIFMRVLVWISDFCGHQNENEECENGKQDSDDVVHSAGNVEKIVDEQNKTGCNDKSDRTHNELWVDSVSESENKDVNFDI